MTDPTPLGDQPAFPELHIHHWKDAVGDCSVPRWHGGLTKRELFAALAPVPNIQMVLQDVDSEDARIIFATSAANATRWADALLTALAKETKP